MIWEADMLRIQREKLTRTLNRIAASQENGETKKQGKTMERNLLFMIASVWCVRQWATLGPDGVHPC